MQMPAVAVVTVDPDTAHMSGVVELKDTGSPEDAEADRVTCCPAVVSGGWAKAIVCGASPAPPGMSAARWGLA